MSIGELNADGLESLSGRTLDGRYRLVKYVDRGGFGAVYLGLDGKFNQPVAVKVGLSYRDFMKEAKLAAEVRHDHIVQVTDYGHDNGLAFMVMEFLNGDSLEKLFLKQDRRLSPEQLCQLVREVGDALAQAHADHLVHRDLKPRNIMLKEPPTKSGTSSFPKKFVLLDFGIAAKLDAEGTQRNRTKDGAGTVEYMAPELLQTPSVATPQSDIYAFGVILYQMLVGRVPFPQADSSFMAMAECLNGIARLPPPRFAEVAPDRSFPPGIEALVLQCLEKNPSRRPQTMEEVCERFLACYEPKPEPPAPPPSSGRPWLWMTTALLLIGLSVAGAFAWKDNQSGPVIDPVASLFIRQGDDSFIEVKDGLLELLAGSDTTLALRIDGLPSGTIPVFETPELPTEAVRAELLNGLTAAVGHLKLSVPDLNTRSMDLPQVTWRASIPGYSPPVEVELKLRIREPEPWLPQAKEDRSFQMASDAKLCRVGNRIFATVLELRAADRSVRFRLIPGREIDDRRIDTFYISERLISNDLFARFADEQPDFEVERRGFGEHPWRSADEAPVTDVLAIEAQRFAWWLVGPQGGLPTATEWDIASGYYEFVQTLNALAERGERPKTLGGFLKQPVTLQDIAAKVWIGLDPADCIFEGQQQRSPYGLQYDLKSGMRLTELTATVLHDLDLGTERNLRSILPAGAALDKEALLLYQARLRGYGRTADLQTETPFLWAEESKQGVVARSVKSFNDTCGSVTLLPSPEIGIASDSYIGFRIVLLTDNTSR